MLFDFMPLFRTPKTWKKKSTCGNSEMATRRRRTVKGILCLSGFCAGKHEIWSRLWQNSRNRCSGVSSKPFTQTLKKNFLSTPLFITHPSVTAVLWHAGRSGPGDTVHETRLQPASRFRPGQGSDICFSSARPRFLGLPLAATQHETLHRKHAPGAS